MITTAELAARSDFAVGLAVVSPSTRTVRGPRGSADVEPRVMQVLVALADGRGHVVSRETLFDRCWGGVTVGDDSLNRAVAGVRRIANDIAGNSFTVETIPRTGYKLAVAGDSDMPADSSNRGSGPTRRQAVAGFAALAATAGGGAWWYKSRGSRKFDDAMARGRAALDYGDGSDLAAKNFREAATLRPDDPDAQGLLAYSLMNPNGTVRFDEAAQAMRDSQAIDPNNVYAGLAEIEIERANLDILETERRLLRFQAAKPDDIRVKKHLWDLYQSSGRSREALGLVERAVAIKPLAASANFPLGQILWINGRSGDADRVLERAIQVWPDHRYVRFARFTVMTYTGRPRAALAMLENPATRPQIYKAPAIDLWRKALPVIDDPTPAKVGALTQASVAAVKANPALTAQAVMSLAFLGQQDAAFDLANQLLVYRNPVPGNAPKRGEASSVAWRFTPWLFTPPVESLQRDPRFMAICDGIGLSEYWRRRGIRPDFLSRQA